MVYLVFNFAKRVAKLFVKVGTLMTDRGLKVKDLTGNVDNLRAFICLFATPEQTMKAVTKHWYMASSFSDFRCYSAKTVAHQ